MLDPQETCRAEQGRGAMDPLFPLPSQGPLTPNPKPRKESRRMPRTNRKNHPPASHYPVLGANPTLSQNFGHGARLACQTSGYRLRVLRGIMVSTLSWPLPVPIYFTSVSSFG